MGASGMSYRVAVRTLCEFTARRGDLDLRFTPAPTAQEGIAGHARVTARRPEGYLRELPLEGRYLDLEVRGRADGYDPAANRLEEIKTYRGDLARQPANHRALHWAQARVYGWLLCQARGLDAVELALVYLDVATGQETLLAERHAAADLRTFFEAQCDAFLAWARQEAAHRAARDAALGALRFPFADFRAGQRPLAEAVYKAACTGSHLLVQAPTGIGKTLATLFPQLKAMPGQGLDRLFYLAAKTPGRRLALDALAQLDDGRALRVLELTARDKRCLHPAQACHGESCPLARGFHDRLPAARAEAVARGALALADLDAVAAAHRVCPYYLAQEMARWADVVVGDYSYYFDQSALLYGLLAQNGWRVGVLVDEAHNLLERARGLYSAELDPLRFAALRRGAPAALKAPLERLLRQWGVLNRAQTADYQVDEQLPEALLGALHGLIGAVATWLNEQPAGLSAEWQTAWFDALAFTRLADSFGPHALFDRQRLPSRSGQRAARTRLCLRNVVPAPYLAPRFAAARSCVLFSATLTPHGFHADTLGLPPHIWLDVPSPFAAGQLEVRIAEEVSTRYADRAASRPAIVARMAAQYHARPGNYLAFFSSFEYLQQVHDAFVAAHPDIPCWQQARQMREDERAAFLGRFAEDGRGIGFAVLGGAFGEGIDLPGRRLIGAFVATLGLPQVNPVNEHLRQRLDALFGAGYDYAYLYPGLQKVVQAAGRVIRTLEDRGVVHLIDDRFAQPRIRRLLPAWWALPAR